MDAIPILKKHRFFMPFDLSGTSALGEWKGYRIRGPFSRGWTFRAYSCSKGAGPLCWPNPCFTSSSADYGRFLN